MATKAEEGRRGGRDAPPERSKCLARKFQEVVERLKGKGLEGDTSEEEEEEEEGAEGSGSDEELQLPETIGVSLNLSKKNMKHFPENLLEKMRQVQCLYLEGNRLSELPQNFFQSLSFLKWLDLRNNALTSLPTPGLKHHPCLEVILLQGNRIRNLPVELATIPTLNGLQTSGNPITNVPYEVIVGGFRPVMNHLAKLLSQEEILHPVSSAVVVKPSTSQDRPVEKDEPTDSEVRMWDLEKLSQWRHFMKKKSSGLPQDQMNLHHLAYNHGNPKPELHQPKISVSVRSQANIPAKPQPFRCGVYNRHRLRSTAAAARHLKLRKTPLGYRRKPITAAMIQEKARRETHRAQVRETLEKQAKKIQRMRDKEILQTWRDHSAMTREQMKLLDNYQQYPSRDFAAKTPFDVDPEFLCMLNRVDLYRTLKDYDNRSKRKKKPKVKITALDLERQMNEIIKKLKEFDTKDEGEELSPRTKHSHLCNKMHKIMDIQKTLKNLQKLNSSVNGMTPLIKKKSQGLSSNS